MGTSMASSSREDSAPNPSGEEEDCGSENGQPPLDTIEEEPANGHLEHPAPAASSSSNGLSSAEPHPPPPDRDSFQADLNRLNKDISHHRKEQQSTREIERKEFEQCRSIKNHRLTLKEKTDVLNANLKEQLGLAEELRTQMKSLEPDLRYRYMDKLDRELGLMEQKYQKNKNNREEKNIVAQLDLLRRNKKKLEKYNALSNEKRGHEIQITIIKSEIDECISEQKTLRKQQQTHYNKSCECRDYLRSNGNNLACLLSDRKQLISDYENSRIAYADWVKANRKAALRATSSFPATFPLVHRGADSVVEVEELEPFYEQKRDCHLLIKYLTRLDAQNEASSQNGQSSELSTLDDESAEEFPEAFSRLAVQPASRKKKAHHHKKTAKQHQPLSHTFDIVKLFTQVEIEAPKCLSAVRPVLAKVRALLEEYESQTVDMEWDDEQYGSPSMTHSRAYSLADSGAADFSDAASLTSSRHYTTSLSSPSSPVYSKNDEV